MNMDIKDLIAKLKSGSSGNKRGGGLTGFFEKNPKMKVIIPAICLGISVLVALVIIFTTGTIEIDESPVGGNNSGAQVDVLPQDVRNYEDIEVLGDDVFDDVALANAEYIGYASPHTAVINNPDYCYYQNEILYPKDEDMPKVEYYHDLPESVRMHYENLWLDLKLY